jgi:hypothetical protein
MRERGNASRLQQHCAPVLLIGMMLWCQRTVPHVRFIMWSVPAECSICPDRHATLVGIDDGVDTYQDTLLLAGRLWASFRSARRA